MKESQESKVQKIFHCHVPKCAGTSVIEAIRQLYIDAGKQTFKINLAASRATSQLFSFDMMSLREIILSYNLSIPKNFFGSGHVYCRPQVVESYRNEWDFITVLRNPIDRWISEYVFNKFKSGDWGKNTLPIEEYMVSPKGILTGINFIRYFSSMVPGYQGNFDELVEEAVANLNQFSVIGTVENMDAWCESFNKRYNKKLSIPQKNTSPNFEAFERIRSNRSLMIKIEKLCEPDLRVYHEIVKHL